MMVSKVSPLVRMVSVNPRCSRVRSVSSSKLVMPMTAFIGVRISWLMVARKALLAWLAASASWRARWASWYSRALSSARDASWPKRLNSSTSFSPKVRPDSTP